MEQFIAFVPYIQYIRYSRFTVSNAALEVQPLGRYRLRLHSLYLLYEWRLFARIRFHRRDRGLLDFHDALVLALAFVEQHVVITKIFIGSSYQFFFCDGRLFI